MKSALEKWLSPETEEEEDETPTQPKPVLETPKPANNFSLDTTKAKQTKADSFDSLFDEKTSTNSEDYDDLPF